MSSEAALLPDLGARLVSMGVGSTQLVGSFDMDAMGWIESGFTVSGRVRVDEDACASLDFTDETWRDFARLLNRVFCLDPGRVLTRRNLAVRVDPPLPMMLSMTVQPGKSTSSRQSGEEFVPLIVQSVRDIGLDVDAESIEVRKRWWIGLTRRSVQELGTGGEALAGMVTLAGTHSSSAEEEILRGLVACTLVRVAQAGEELDGALKAMVSSGWLDKRKLTGARKQSRVLAGAEGDQSWLERRVVELLVLYLAVAIYAQRKLSEFEEVMEAIWGVDGSKRDYLLGEARYCVARRPSPALQLDDIEETIVEVCEKHEGIREICAGRLATYSKDAWDHPEVRSAVQAYVRYDVLRQVQKYQPGMIPALVVERCEQNIKTIAQWIKMLSVSEAELLTPGGT